MATEWLSCAGLDGRQVDRVYYYLGRVVVVEGGLGLEGAADWCEVGVQPSGRDDKVACGVTELEVGTALVGYGSWLLAVPTNSQLDLNPRTGAQRRRSGGETLA